MTESPITRRHILAAAGGAVGALALSPALRTALGDQHRRYRISACDWSIDRKLDLDAMRLAEEVGLDGVEVSFDRPDSQNDLRKQEVRQAYREAAKKHGVAISSLAMGVLNQVPYASEPQTQQWMLDGIDACQALGVDVMLIAFFGNGDINGQRDLQDRVIQKFRQAAPYAEQQGVTLGIESWLNADDHLRIVEQVDSPNVQVYYDTANMHKMGYDIYEEIPRLGDRICQIHMKENGRLLGRGPIDFKRVREALEEADYQGWLVIESSREEGKSVEACYTHNVQHLRSLFGSEA